MKISLIGLGEELGLPSLKNQKQNFQTRLLDAIEDKFKQEYEIEKLNTFSYIFNKSWHLDSIIKNNCTLTELEKIRRIGNEFAKKESIMMNIFSPRIKKIKCENKRIIELIENKSIILYDIGINDFMYYAGNNVVAAHVLFNKNKKANKILKKDKVFLDVFNGVKNNIDNILKINKNTNIYILGFTLNIFVPSIVCGIYNSSKTYKTFNKYLSKWNNMLKSLESDNVHFIDLSLYKNKEEALTKIPLNIKLGNSGKNKLEINNTGILGMIEDLKNDKVHLKESLKEIKYLKTIEKLK